MIDDKSSSSPALLKNSVLLVVKMTRKKENSNKDCTRMMMVVVVTIVGDRRGVASCKKKANEVYLITSKVIRLNKQRNVIRFYKIYFGTVRFIFSTFVPKLVSLNKTINKEQLYFI